MRSSICLVAVTVISLAAATIIDRTAGMTAAEDAVYHNPLFFALLFLTVLSVGISMWRSGLFRIFPVAGMYAAVILILFGSMATHLFSWEAYLHLREGEAAEYPVQITLEHFEIVNHPGTESPMDYVSSVILQDGTRATVSMNRVLKVDGYRLMQFDYDIDGRGTTLLCTHDPWGTALSYAGYFLLFLSMIAYFFDGRTEFRRIVASLGNTEGKSVSRFLFIVDGLMLAYLSVIIALRWVLSGHIPLSSGADVMTFIAWLAMLIPLVYGRKSAVLYPPALILAALAILAASFGDSDPHTSPLPPVLASPMLTIHVGCMILSYTLLGLAALNSMFAIFRRGAGGLASLSRLFLYPATFLLAGGTFIGAIWANMSWGSYWSWDPKEVWALITLLIYSTALLIGAGGKLKEDRYFNFFCIFAFLSVLFTYFGVNYLLGGMHAYA